MRGFLLAAFLTVLAIAGFSVAFAERGQMVQWVDADTFDIGSTRYRLMDVDAPETGGVGSYGGAKCETERTRGKAATQFMKNATAGRRVVIKQVRGNNRNRLVASAAIVGGGDLGDLCMRAGHCQPWPHDASNNALTPKPNWCGRMG